MSITMKIDFISHSTLVLGLLHIPLIPCKCKNCSNGVCER